MFKRITKLGFPRQFQIVQFPNLPLIIALVADQVGHATHGMDHAYVITIAYTAMIIWAYEELIHGVNWFRHLLGLAFIVIAVMRVAHVVHG